MILAAFVFGILPFQLVPYRDEPYSSCTIASRSVEKVRCKIMSKCIVQRREEDDCKNENAILMFNYIRKNGAFTHKLWHFHEKNVKSAKSQIHGKSLTWIVLSSWALGALTFSGSLEALITKVSMAGLKATIEAATWGSTFKLIQLSTRTVPVIIKFVNCQLIKNNSHQASNSCTFILFDGTSFYSLIN